MIHLKSFWDSKAVFRGEFKSVNTYIGKERPQLEGRDKIQTRD